VNRTIASLLLILVIQCGLVLAVFWPGADSLRGLPEPMAPFDRDRIDGIYVGDEFDNETVLAKVGERWFLPELENLPADGAMVDKLLQAITPGHGIWPAADSVAARQRFRVASYHYRRRIRLLEQGDVLGTFFLGTSPGFRKVYTRNESQDAIYSIEFNAHDAPGNSGAWLDRKLLQTRTPLGITADSYSLQREGEDWLSGIGRTPDERELQALLGALRSLQIDGLASEDDQRDLAESEADLLLNVQSLAGAVRLELFHRGDGYFIHSSEYPLFFTLSAYDYDRLVGIDARLVSGEPGAD
jgi:hypothetical protein